MSEFIVKESEPDENGIIDRIEYHVDENGREYQGLIKVRNSWGDRIGDQGNFYMTYDYFRALVIELQRIRQIRSRV